MPYPISAPHAFIWTKIPDGRRAGDRWVTLYIPMKSYRLKFINIKIICKSKDVFTRIAYFPDRVLRSLNQNKQPY